LLTLSITGRAALTELRRAALAGLSALAAAVALSLTLAGPAAAGVGTGVPITLNSPSGGRATPAS
jgi:hypothetical protein